MRRLPIASFLLLAGCVTPGLRVETNPNATPASECMDRFVKPGSPLAAEIARLEAAPVCERTDEGETLKVGGNPQGSKDLSGTFAVGRWRGTQPVAGVAGQVTEILDGRRSADGGTTEVLRRSARTTIDARTIEHSAVILVREGGAAVCVIASNETSGTDGGIVCRVSEGTTRAQEIATADRIVSRDLADLVWQ